MFETEEKVFSERDLLLGILWEGDCQLHTNRPGMVKTPFGSAIVHGNSVTSMVLGQFLKNHFKSKGKISIKELNINYLGPVHVGDRVKGVFSLDDRQQCSKGPERMKIDFEVFKNKETRVSKGTISIEIVDVN
jgi:acyl dehydratase